MLVRQRLLTALATIAVVLGTAGPATAATERHRDAARDVLARDLVADPDLPHTPVPVRSLGDITANRVSYGADLVVTTRFRTLAAAGSQTFSWSIRTPGARYPWNASLTVARGKDTGVFTLDEPLARVGCGGAVLDRAARKVTLTLPATCLASPAWVRVGNGVQTFTETHEYVDDARRDGVVKDGWKYGPKLRP